MMPGVIIAFSVIGRMIDTDRFETAAWTLCRSWKLTEDNMSTVNNVDPVSEWQLNLQITVIYGVMLV